MSYDLVFWRQLKGVTTSAPEIYSRLLKPQRVDGLADLKVEEMLRGLLATFPEALREPNGNGEWVCWTTADGKDSFQVEWVPQAFIVSCRHVHSGEMNRLIDWAASFDCPLYDPQTSERFP